MNDEDQIRELLQTYERSLNTSDPELAASLYTDDAVFMPTTLPTATGSQMRQAYEQIFTAIGLAVSFTIDEIVVASNDVAYALTRSNGTQLDRATGVTTAEANREIFIFRRVDGSWKSPATCSTRPSSGPPARSSTTSIPAHPPSAGDPVKTPARYQHSHIANCLAANPAIPGGSTAQYRRAAERCQWGRRDTPQERANTTARA